MAAWIAKAFIQKCISLLPWKHLLNYFFQKNITKGLSLTDNLFESKLNHCRQHIVALQKYTVYTKDFTALELGTGWYPIVPIGLYLAGAETIYSADIKSTITAKKIQLTIKKILDYDNENKLQQYIPGQYAERIITLKEIYNSKLNEEQMFSRLHIKTIVGDITKSDLQQTSIHLINSNNTFEHIPPVILKTILEYFRKIIHADGVMSHFIDLSDHFSHSDTSISNYNFLKFSETQWKLIDNTIQPQNRLRIPEYRKLLQETKWLIVEEELTSAQADRIDSITISKRFKHFSKEELAVTHALLITKPSV
ncbi:MAG: hypothetical protein H7Y00_05935 [Fimbriimonadaceae bacterium]|nr:hypothetical protein [Chitinophagales bacterium]